MSADPVFGVAAAVESSVIDTPEQRAIVAGLLDVSSPVTLTVENDGQQVLISTGIAVELAQARHEIVFVDTRVDVYEELLKDLLSQNSAERRIEVRILDAQHDGIEQISQVLAGYSELDAVHFISHGTQGAVQLGATWLDLKSLPAFAGSIAGWGAALSENSDLLFYGCDLAASAPGVALIEHLSRLTGADIAASVNRTGTALLGGDWHLELAVGNIETDIALSGQLQQNWSWVLAAPTASNMNAAETYTLNTPLNLADIVISDVDSANVTARLTLSDPGAGSLSTATSGAVTSTYNAVTGVWTASGAIADVNALLADVTYTPTLLYILPFTIATSVDDGVEPPITGSKSMSSGLLNLSPSASNLNVAETYTEDTPLDLTNIVVSDVDSPNVTATLTLSDLAAGSLSTGASGSVTSTFNAATGVWSASGAIADVNALLAGVTFTPAANYNSDFTIATSVDDGVAPAITGVKNMTGIAVNDAPVLANNNLTITEGGSVVLSGAELSATDVDDAAPSLTFTVSGVSAGHFELITSPGVAITSFTQGQVSGGEVRFVHDGGEAAPSYNVTVSDAVSSVGPAPATISFTNQNDAPVLGNNRLTISQGNSVVLSSANLSAADVDNVVASLTFTVFGVTGGQFEFVTSPGVAITTFTQAQVSVGEVRFVHDGGTAAPSYAVTVADDVASVGPVTATINFRALQETVEVIPPPLPVTGPGGVIVGEEPIIVDGGPVNNLNPTSDTTGAATTNPAESATLLQSNASELLTPADTTVQEDLSMKPALSRMFNKPPSGIQEEISARSQAHPLNQNADIEETALNTIASGDLSSVIDVRGFVKGLDELRDEISQDNFFEKTAVGSTLTLTTGLSIGYFIWLVRGEILLSSLLASLPAWRLVDPLPVLASLMKRSNDIGEDDDSIEDVVKKGGEALLARPVPMQHRGSRSVKWRLVMQSMDPAQESSS